MPHNVTAVYRSYTAADLVRRHLMDIGIQISDVHVIPDADAPAPTGGYRQDTRFSDRLHELHLPEDDVRDYQQCVRRGDYVVSVEVDEARVGTVEEIMRHPETKPRELDSGSVDFTGEKLIPHTAGDAYRLDEELRARRTAGEGSARVYQRRKPLQGIGP